MFNKLLQTGAIFSTLGLGACVDRTEDTEDEVTYTENIRSVTLVDLKIDAVKGEINRKCTPEAEAPECMELINNLNDLFQLEVYLKESLSENYSPEVAKSAQRVILVSMALFMVSAFIEKYFQKKVNRLQESDPLAIEAILKEERMMDVVRHLKYILIGSGLVQASPLYFGMRFSEQELEVTNWGTALVAVATFLVPFRGMDRSTEKKHVHVLQYATSIMLGTFVGANALMLPYSSLTWSEILLASGVCLAYWTSSPLSRALTLDRFLDFHPDVADQPELKRALLNLITAGRRQDLVDAVLNAVAAGDMNKAREILARHNISLAPSENA